MASPFKQTNITKFNELQYFGIAALQGDAFLGCTQLTEVTLPAECTEIVGGTGGMVGSLYPGAFSGCTSLVKVNHGIKLKKIGTHTFRDCVNLYDMSLDGIEEIGVAAFANCTKFAPSVCPSSIVSIGAEAFNSTTIDWTDIPSSVENIGSGAFANCAKLRLSSIPSACGNPLSFKGCKAVTFSELPAGATLTQQAFYSCWGITKMTIPAGVSLPTYAFGDCKNLKEVHLPSTPPSCASNAFDWCHKDLKFYVPTGSKSAYLAAAGWSSFDESKFIEE